MFATLISLTKRPRYVLESVLFRVSGSHRRLEEYKDQFAGRPLLIVGNGPSLNKTPLDAFSHIPSIGMNKIDLIFERSTWRPNAIVCTNNMVARQHRSTFKQLDIPVLLAWKSRWFVGRKSANISYFNLDESAEFSDSFPTKVGSGPTVTYQALQLAYYTGADPVIIVGVDHRFDKTDNKPSYERRKGEDTNHFHPDYFKDGSLWGLPDLEASEIVYGLALDAFNRAGRTIVDATVDGGLQVFPKISIAEALELTRPSSDPDAAS